MFRIKICGITNVEDAIATVDAGADAIGLNFYEKSPRCISESQSLEIFQAIHRRIRNSGPDRELIQCVGVFVNTPVERVKHLKAKHHLTSIQLHGDESPEFVGQFQHTESILPSPYWSLIRARPFSDSGLPSLAADLIACNDAGCRPDALLVDAMATGQYGGSGERLPWQELTDHRKQLGNTALILAGGLTPDNVAEAIRIVRPAAVDVASGVESAPGKKDPIKVRDFVAAAQAAFESFPG